MPLVTHLFLDKALPSEIREYFTKRANAKSPPFECSEVDLDWSREDVRARMTQIGLTAALVVDSSHASGIRGLSDVRVSKVSQAPNGWVLSEWPEAIPLPALKESVLWDDRSGPLIPDPQMSRVRDDRPYSKPVRTYGEFGAVPSFDFSTWLPNKDHKCSWFGEAGASASGALAGAFIRAALGEALTETFLWRLERRIFVLGPHRPVLDEIARHHRLEAPTKALDAVSGLARALNPYRLPSWEGLRAEVQASCGLDLSPTLETRALLSILGIVEEAATGTPSLLTASPSDEARDFVQLLARREVVSWRRGDAFLFEAIAEAPLRVVPKPGGGMKHQIIANLGAGQLVMLSAWCFTSDKAEALQRERATSARWFDGGDVRVAVADSTDSLLEGTSLVAKKKRLAAQDD